MASFSEENFVKKLVDLNNSQQSIQTLSLWLIHHRKHSSNIVDIWGKQIKEARGGKKLTFVYLANDVLQNSKKKGPEFNRDFRKVLVDGYRETAKEADDKTKGSLDRMLNIWLERAVFEKDFIEKLRKLITGASSSDTSSSKKSSEKRHEHSKTKNDAKAVEEPAEKKSAEKKSADKSDKKSTTESAKKSSDAAPPKKKKKVELSLREEIELEMQDGIHGEPPTADELIKALSDLENSASSDAAVRERIAALPSKVSDIAHLETLKDTAEADELAKDVDEACELLANYNGRLAEELLERKRIAKMLRNFIAAQKEALVESEKKYQEYSSRLEKVDAVHKELQSHVQSLPDLTLLPDVTTGGLAPLPSAGDLFSN